MSTAATPVYGWNDLPWKKLQRTVFKLQTRIYQANRRGDTKAVRRLQRLLVTSRSAKLLAVRRVTQDNRGKRTAGVDGVKSLTPPQRLTLAQTLALPTKARPVRRVWIPKPGTNERRPLGIPMRRAYCISIQAASRFATERPPWGSPTSPFYRFYRRGSHVMMVCGGSTAAAPACAAQRSPPPIRAPTRGRAAPPGCRPGARPYTTPRSSCPRR